MQTQFFLVDKLILVAYFMGVIFFGAYFRKKSNTPSAFMVADGRLPGWAVGLSILGTFVSSITFLAYPGQAYNSNWDVFMFSLTLPVAAVFASLYFIPLYRTKVKVSAYEYLEQRFGSWARIYGSISFMLGSLARIGMILFLVSLVLHHLTGMVLYNNHSCHRHRRHHLHGHRRHRSGDLDRCNSGHRSAWRRHCLRNYHDRRDAGGTRADL